MRALYARLIEWIIAVTVGGGNPPPRAAYGPADEPLGCWQALDFALAAVIALSAARIAWGLLA